MSNDSNEIINKVATSGLITLDLEEFYPEGERVLLDIAPVLWQGLVLKEKDFRDFIKNHDWIQYQNKLVAVICSADALVPTWAYMLIASKLSGIAKTFHFGSLEELEVILYLNEVTKIPIEKFKDSKVVIKGCSNKPVPIAAYVELTRLLAPIASSIMFGEPCSTVPIFKKK